MTPLEIRVVRYIEEHRDELFRLLCDLIRYDSQNFISHGREQACAEYIARLYTEAGLDTELYFPDDVPGVVQHPEYLKGRGTDSRPNVSGVLRGEDPSLRCMLAAHIDTMPVGDRDKWTVDPFGGEMRDGRIYGLGACDNKFGIAGALFTVRALKACGVRLKKSLVLTSYVDEEYGGGGGALAAGLKYPCDTIVNYDGGNYELWTASLGGGGYGITVRTERTTDTVSPVIDALYEIKARVERLGERRRAELHANALYTGSDMQRSALRILEFGCGSFGTDLDSGKMIFVLYTTSDRSTIEAELRHIEDELRPVLAKYGVTTEGFIPTTRFFGYHRTENRTGAAGVMAEAAREASGRPVPERGACLSDLSVFLSAGSPESFSFGVLRDFSLPGGAHQPDEYVDCGEFLDHTRAAALFLLRCIGTVE